MDSLRIEPIGDAFAQLDALIQSLAETPKLLESISKEMATEDLGFIVSGFSSETDPYGIAWKPKQKPDGRPVLSGKTSRLKSGWHVARYDKNGFEIAPSVAYSGPLQKDRPMVADDRGAPPKWQAAFSRIAGDRFAKQFGAK